MTKPAYKPRLVGLCSYGNKGFQKSRAGQWYWRNGYKLPPQHIFHMAVP